MNCALFCRSMTLTIFLGLLIAVLVEYLIEDNEQLQTYPSLWIWCLMEVINQILIGIYLILKGLQPQKESDTNSDVLVHQPASKLTKLTLILFYIIIPLVLTLTIWGLAIYVDINQHN